MTVEIEMINEEADTFAEGLSDEELVTLIPRLEAEKLRREAEYAQEADATPAG